MHRVMVYNPRIRDWEEWFRSASRYHADERAKAMGKALRESSRVRVVMTGKLCEQRKGA